MLSRTRNSIVVLLLFLIIVLVNQSLFEYIFYLYILYLSYFVFYLIAANRVCCSVVVAVVVCRLLVQSFYANTRRETVCDLQ